MIHTYRCDGSLFKSLEGYHCIFESESSWIFFLPPLKAQQIKEIEQPQYDTSRFPKRKKCSSLTNRYPAFWFFWKEHWFNVLLTLFPKNKYNLLLRIATPPLVEEKAFKYIELDLALTLNNEKELNLLYNDNYQFNSQKMKYTPNLKKEVSKVIRQVFQLLKSNWFNRLVEEQRINSLWEKVLIVTGKEKSEFYREIENDKKDEEFSGLGIEIGEIR